MSSSDIAGPETPADAAIAFQGRPGAYSHLACREAVVELAPLPCETFEDVFAALSDGLTERAMIPIENSLAGRVADIHHLLPESGLHIIGEHFQRVQHQLLGPPGATLEGLEVVHSHVQALGQCRRLIRQLGLKARVHADTAGAAEEVAKRGDPTESAIASRLAGDIYKLSVLRSDIEDASHNTTRFVIMAREAFAPVPGSGPVMTSFVFRVRNVPAALYKALGGFATNGVNMVKLESYQVGEAFNQAQFYADIEGHPEDRSVRLALEELDFYSEKRTVLGVYPAHPFRQSG
jgi:prephenate dehydratase